MELTVKGEIIYAATGGKTFDPDRATVVFVHGVAQDHTIWVLPTRYFARHDRNVLAVDLPGHGRSGGAPLRSIADMADWVVALLDTAGAKQAAVVGHSMGSLVALDTAGRYPERIRSLVMVGISIPLTVATPLMESAAAHSHDTIDMLNYWSYSTTAQIGGSPTPGLWMLGGGLRLMEQSNPATIHTDLTTCDSYTSGLERAAAVRCPTLLLLGEKDRMTPARGAEALSETITGSRTVVFEGAGHPLLEERSDQVLDELITVV